MNVLGIAHRTFSHEPSYTQLVIVIHKQTHSDVRYSDMPQLSVLNLIFANIGMAFSM